MRKGILAAAISLGLIAAPVFAAAGNEPGTGKPAATAKKKTRRHATGHKTHAAHKPVANPSAAGTN